jgi:hypothetical protein
LAAEDASLDVADASFADEDASFAAVGDASETGSPLRRCVRTREESDREGEPCRAGNCMGAGAGGPLCMYGDEGMEV